MARTKGTATDKATDKASGTERRSAKGAGRGEGNWPMRLSLARPRCRSGSWPRRLVRGAENRFCRAMQTLQALPWQVVVFIVWAAVPFVGAMLTAGKIEARIDSIFLAHLVVWFVLWVPGTLFVLYMTTPY